MAIDPNRDFTPGELTRMLEATAGIQFPTAEEQNFRLGLMKIVGRRLGMAEVRSLTITGPCQGVQRPPRGGGKGGSDA